MGLVVGSVDEACGVAVWSENLGWRDVPCAALLAERLGRPVAFGHDVRAGGLATDGRVHDAGGHAGEIGHTDVGHGEPCVCGS